MKKISIKIPFWFMLLIMGGIYFISPIFSIIMLIITLLFSIIFPQLLILFSINKMKDCVLKYDNIEQLHAIKILINKNMNRLRYLSIPIINKKISFGNFLFIGRNEISIVETKLSNRIAYLNNKYLCEILEE